MIEESEKEEGAEPVVGWTEEEAVEIEAVILVRSVASARARRQLTLRPAAEPNGAAAVPLAFAADFKDSQLDAASHHLATTKAQALL